MFKNLPFTILPVPNSSLYFIRLLASKRPQRPRLGLCEDVALAVDVFITYWGGGVLILFLILFEQHVL